MLPAFTRSCDSGAWGRIRLRDHPVKNSCLTQRRNGATKNKKEEVDVTGWIYRLTPGEAPAGLRLPHFRANGATRFLPAFVCCCQHLRDPVIMGLGAPCFRAFSFYVFRCAVASLRETEFSSRHKDESEPGRQQSSADSGCFSRRAEARAVSIPGRLLSQATVRRCLSASSFSFYVFRCAVASLRETEFSSRHKDESEPGRQQSSADPGCFSRRAEARAVGIPGRLLSQATVRRCLSASSFSFYAFRCVVAPLRETEFSPRHKDENEPGRQRSAGFCFLNSYPTCDTSKNSGR